MKPAILLAVLAVAATACDRRDEVQDTSRTTDTTLAPGTDTSTDPAATLDQSARSSNPDLLDPYRGDPAALPTDSAMGDGDVLADPTRVDDASGREYPRERTQAPPAPPRD